MISDRLNGSLVKTTLPHILTLCLAFNATLKLQSASTEWQQYGGDHASSQYSPLKQIHRANVQQLIKVWEYHSESGQATPRTQIQCNPIIVDGVLYGSSPTLKFFALDAATGLERWQFNPFIGTNPIGVNRGVIHHGQGSTARIFLTASHWLYAVNAETGVPIASFGADGRVDLRQGLGRDAEKLFILSNTPGVAHGNLIVLGTRVSEGPGPSAPGYIRAYRVDTGAMEWVFHTIPQQDEFGHHTWPKEAWKTAGGANAWSGLSIDPKRGWVFCPTGSPAFDFWGGNRKGENLFGNCLIALDIKTGRRIWHYQVVHHDLWDRDLPAAPNLVEISVNGKSIPVVAQVTKSGHVFLFHRETGKPVFSINERPFPPSDLSNEEAWPTQPIPTSPPPFARQSFTPRDISKISKETQSIVSAKLASVRSGGQFIPPSTIGTVIFPGFDGGGEWGGAAWDPDSRWLYVNANEMPWILTMKSTTKGSTRPGTIDGALLYQRLCAACHGLDRMGDSQKTYPSIADIAKKMNSDQIIEQMSQGKGLMPAFSFLNQNEKSAIADFLIEPQSLQELGKDLLPEKNNNKPSEYHEPYTHTGYNRFLDPDGYPAIKPPWGTLNAIDLENGRIAWQVTLGEFEELKARGISPTGTENYGGPVVTGGGLVFIGASKDEKFRAFDKSTGALLWETKLPAGGYATPSIYEVQGKQFVVIACGGGKMNTKSGASYIAFALKHP